MLKNNLILGALLITLSELAILMTGMIIKTLSDDIPTEQIVFIRNFIGLCLLLPWLIKKGVSRLHTEHFGLHLMRGLIGLTAMVCLFYSWGHLPLAQASLLKQMSPIFIPIFAYFWIKESIGIKTVLAIFIGFIGVAFVINPDAESSTVNFVILIALLGAMLGALAKVVIRKMRPTETPGRIVFYFALIGTLASVVPALLVWVNLNWIQFGSLVSIAIFSTAGQLLLSKAYGLAPAGQLGIYTYSSVVFAALFGWLIWGEVLSFNTVLGIIIVLLASLLAVMDRKKSS